MLCELVNNFSHAPIDKLNLCYLAWLGNRVDSSWKSNLLCFKCYAKNKHKYIYKC